MIEHLGKGDIMLQILSDLASDFTVLRAYRDDPDALLARYPELTDEEKRLLKDGDSSAIEGHLRGGTSMKPSTVLLAAIIIIRIDDPEAAGQHDRQYWDECVHRLERKAA